MKPRRSRIVLTSAWLLTALGALPAIAQQPGTPASLRARLEGRLDPKARAVVEHVIDSAYAQGIPTNPLVLKALEGVSKGGSPEAIVRAVRTLAADLGVARQALGEQSMSDELSAGAMALQAGVDAKALRKLRDDRQGQPLSVALGVLSDLIARGVPVKDATRSVLDLTKAGVADEQLVAFRRDVERDVGMGASPAAAAVLHANGLSLSVGGGAAGAGGKPAAPGKPHP